MNEITLSKVTFDRNGLAYNVVLVSRTLQKSQSKTGKLKPYQQDREALGMFLRCWDREPRMMSREDWGESLPESVQVIEENKTS